MAKVSSNYAKVCKNNLCEPKPRASDNVKHVISKVWSCFVPSYQTGLYNEAGLTSTDCGSQSRGSLSEETACFGLKCGIKVKFMINN